MSLYWIFSKIIEIYSIPDDELSIIQNNFIKMDIDRLSAKDREYKEKPDDDIFSDLSIAMSSGTDGLDAITNRHDIITQFIFNNVNLNPIPSLDPKRNFTYEEKLILYRKAQGLCELEYNGKKCGRPIEFDDAVVDHIRPHSKQGQTELSNGRIAHQSCNIARGNRDDYDPATMCKILTTETNEEKNNT